MAGQALTRAVQANEICAKYGGDEFYVLLNGDSHDAAAFIQRVKRYLENYNRLKSRGYDVAVSAGSATCACADLTDEESLEKLISQADKNMYKDKLQRKALRSAQ